MYFYEIVTLIKPKVLKVAQSMGDKAWAQAQNDKMCGMMYMKVKCCFAPLL